MNKHTTRNRLDKSLPHCKTYNLNSFQTNLAGTTSFYHKILVVFQLTTLNCPLKKPTVREFSGEPYNAQQNWRKGVSPPRK